MSNELFDIEKLEALVKRTFAYQDFEKQIQRNTSIVDGLEKRVATSFWDGTKSDLEKDISIIRERVIAIEDVSHLGHFKREAAGLYLYKFIALSAFCYCLYDLIATIVGG